MVNFGDVIYQFLMLFILLAIIYAIIYVIKTVIKKNVPQQSKSIESKLDKIIELLEKDKNH